jgi:hypothetical protein
MILLRPFRAISVSTFFIGLVAFFLATATAMAACGDGTVNPGEDCDDGSQNGTANSCCTSACTFSGKSPDVIVGDLVGTSNYGTVSGITAYSVGTTSCNLGSCWLNWISTTAEHPVIGQNMFRLKDGRFEQIGQSWLKHGFTALQQTTCSTSCNAAPSGAHLGVLCSDPYSTGLNGTESNLGPKNDVNPNTGVYLYPDSRISLTGSAIYKRLQVHNTDLDPALNTGALYFVEGQYVSHDDASAKMNPNNASYRPITVGASPFNITLTGSTQRQKAGIQAWKATDPTVTEATVGAPEGLFILSAKATSLGGGIYHYEYALQNLNNQRAGQSFTVPLPAGTVVTNVGFHDVDYHSSVPAELYDGTDWPSTVTSSSVTWATTTYDVNPNANALRWGTLYNFRFDANQAPGTGSITIGMFRPGSPTSVAQSTVTPGPCGGAPDGTACSDGNACTVADTCHSGTCTPGGSVVCTASDACHDVGTCAPATGACSNPAKPNGTACSDGSACTVADTCQSGTCAPGSPVVCSPIDQCHDAGTCAPATGTCSNPAKPNGSACNDGNLCTQSDTCQSGACASGSPVICTASDACHQAGTCAPATGTCSDPAAPDGTVCSDGDACTQVDACQSGVCAGGSPVVCAASDACHQAGTCAPATGTCSDPVAPDGTPCADADLCTQSDSCVSGVCTSGAPVVCTPIDACHDAGTCDSGTGGCSNPPRTDGTACDDANVCTTNDMCGSGVCAGVGNPVPDEVDAGVQLSQSAGVTTISWNAAIGSTSSGVLRGLVSALPVGPGGGDEVCLQDGVAGTSTIDAQDPDPGAAFWYLVQGANDCGKGPYGFQMQDGVATVPRVSATCP